MLIRGRSRRVHWHCHRMLHPNQEVKIEPQPEYDSSPASEYGRDRLRASPDENALRPDRYGFDPKSGVESSLRAQAQRGSQPIPRPPPAFLDKHGNIQLNVVEVL